MAHDEDPPGSDRVSEALTGALRVFVRRGRQQLSRAAESGRQRLELRQLQSDLDHFWGRLGRTAYHLTQSGEIDHPALRKAMDRIDELEARIDELRQLRQEPLPGEDDSIT